LCPTAPMHPVVLMLKEFQGLVKSLNAHSSELFVQIDKLRDCAIRMQDECLKLPAGCPEIARFRNSVLEVVGYACALDAVRLMYYKPNAQHFGGTCGLFGELTTALGIIPGGEILLEKISPERGWKSCDFDQKLAATIPILLRVLGSEPWIPASTLYDEVARSTVPGTCKPEPNLAGRELPAPPAYLTAAQRTACAEIEVTAQILWSSEWSGLPVRPRFAKLLVGASGIGKTFAVQRAAGELGVPLLRLTYGDWLVVGGWNTALHTIWVVHDFVRNHDCGIIHIDELDKVGARDTSWDASVRVELFNILDGKPAGSDERTQRAWTPEMQERLQSQFLIVGSGTWQSLWIDRPRSIGFGGGNSVSDVVDSIRKSAVIPPELLQRFCAELCVLPPLTPEDAREAIIEMGMESLGLQPTPSVLTEIAESNLGMRWFEEFATRALIRRRQQPADDFDM